MKTNTVKNVELRIVPFRLASSIFKGAFTKFLRLKRIMGMT